MSQITLYVLFNIMMISSLLQNIENNTNSLNIIIEKNVLNAEDENEKKIIKN